MYNFRDNNYKFINVLTNINPLIPANIINTQNKNELSNTFARNPKITAQIIE